MLSKYRWSLCFCCIEKKIWFCQVREGWSEVRLSGCLPPLSSKVRVFHFHYGCCWTVVAAVMLVLLLEIISGVRRNAHVFHLYPPRGLLLAWLLSPFVQWLLSDSCFFSLWFPCCCRSWWLYHLCQAHQTATLLTVLEPTEVEFSLFQEGQRW